LYKLLDRAAAAERYSAAIAALGCAAASDSASTLAPGAGDRDSGPLLALAAHDRTLWLGRGHGTTSQGGSLRFEFLRPVGGRHFALGARGRLRPPAPLATRRERVALVQAGDLGDLQAALYLNRARCWLALGSPARTVQDCEMALALRRAALGPPEPRPGETEKGLRSALALHGGAGAAVLVALLATLLGALGGSSAMLCCGATLLAVGVAAWAWLKVCQPSATGVEAGQGAEEPRDVRLCTALFLRGKARVAQGRLKAAEADVSAAEARADGEAQLRDVARLRRELAEARRDNKRLAKEVAKWCDAAMAKASPDAFAAVNGLEAAGGEE